VESIAAAHGAVAQAGQTGHNGPDGAELLAARFESLYITVYGYLLHRRFDRELAEELTAQTFYRAVKAIGRFQGDDRQFRIWLLRTATNLANTHCRREKLWRLVLGRIGASRPLAEFDEPLVDDVRMLQRERVRRALDALAPSYQAVLVMRYFMDMPFEEIAAVLQCRQDNVRVRLSRAVRAMRRRLGVTEAGRNRVDREVAHA